MKGRNIQRQSQQVVEIVYYNVHDLFMCPKSVSNTVLNYKNNTKVMSRPHQGHLKVKLAENS